MIITKGLGGYTILLLSMDHVKTEITMDEDSARELRDKLDAVLPKEIPTINLEDLS